MKQYIGMYGCDMNSVKVWDITNRFGHNWVMYKSKKKCYARKYKDKDEHKYILYNFIGGRIDET
jgi:hypothetical protein